MDSPRQVSRLIIKFYKATVIKTLETNAETDKQNKTESRKDIHIRQLDI